MPSLIEPHSGALVDLTASADECAELKAYASHLPCLHLTPRQSCDLELLACGALSPLDRFMGQADYQRVLDEMRLSDGHLFPIPVTLAADLNDEIAPGREIALLAPDRSVLAIMAVDETYVWDADEVAQKVLGTRETRHPMVAEVQRWPRTNIAGRLRVIELPRHYDYQALRLTPAETRDRLGALGCGDVVAFQPQSVMHRMHEELLRRAADAVGGSILLQPVVGATRPGHLSALPDHDHLRIRACQAVANSRALGRVVLSLLPLATWMGGPREALLHALVHRNYGANHLMVGRHHASPHSDAQAPSPYGPCAAQEMVQRYSRELGVQMMPFGTLGYHPKEGRYLELNEVQPGARGETISEAQVLEEYLHQGRELPQWFVGGEVAAILADAYPPLHKQGFCVWFTGLSGAGKSTMAEILMAQLQQRGRRVTLLDGDVVRTHLSNGLGYSKQDRDTNIRRIGWVAAEIVRHRGVAICAAVSPYRATRDEVRAMVGAGSFVEVFVDTPLEVCRQRDAKGLYARAQRGEIKGFTGIDDPYEAPLHPELVLDAAGKTAEENATQILQYLRERGFLRDAP